MAIFPKTNLKINCGERRKPDIMIDIGHSNIVFPLLFIGFIILSLVINRILIRFSLNLGSRNQDGQIRWSEETKPALGGFSFYMLFVMAIFLIGMIDFSNHDAGSRQLLGLFLAVSLGFFIGMADDAYNTYPLLKFLGQLTCANILIASGLIIPLTPSIILNSLFTIIWVVAIMNSINMIDNMDGITSVVSIGILLNAMLIVFLMSGVFTTTMLLFALVIASVLGFLFFNWHPARLIMGDSGSQFLGVLLAATSIWCMWNFKNPTGEYFQIRQFLIPLAVFQLPLFDTTTVIIRRLLRGQSPFAGGKDHTTHQFVFLGLSDESVTLLFALIALLSLPEVYILYRLYFHWIWWYSFAVIAFFFIQFLLLQFMYQKGWRKHQDKLMLS